MTEEELTTANVEATVDLTTNKVMGNCDYCCPLHPVQIWARIDNVTGRRVNACVKCLQHSKPIPQPRPQRQVHTWKRMW